METVREMRQIEIDRITKRIAHITSDIKKNDEWLVDKVTRRELLVEHKNRLCLLELSLLILKEKALDGPGGEGLEKEKATWKDRLRETNNLSRVDLVGLTDTEIAIKVYGLMCELEYEDIRTILFLMEQYNAHFKL